MIKYLVCTYSLKDAELIARELYKNDMIKYVKEWEWIPTDRYFRDKATGWYHFVKNNDVEVIGDYSKDSFLRRYERGD